MLVHGLLKRSAMMKPIVASSLLLALLCGPALADPTSTTTYVIELTTKTARHTIFVADRACGELQIKTPKSESYFRVCAHAHDPKTVRLELDRRTRDNHDEARASAVVVAASGASYELLDAKLTVKTR